LPGDLAYVDASALFKLVLPEPESETLEAALAEWRWLSSTLLEVELVLAVRRRKPSEVEAARRVLATGELVEIGAAVRRAAGELDGLRSLDAIHLATALSLGDHVGAFFTYDQRLIAAARAHGLPVSVPQP
jgi:predicted nucleic acid-binding protein